MKVTMLAEKDVEEVFYSILPREMFTLNYISSGVTAETSNGKINIYSAKRIELITHEIAHVIESPNARLFDKDFGLKFPVYEFLSDGITISPIRYKTEVPFKRELRVFGIQYAIFNYMREKYPNLWPKHMQAWDTIVGHAKNNLVGAKENLRAYMCPSLAELPEKELYKLINNKLYQYGEQYHYTNLPQIIKRKFEYIKKNL